MDGDLREAPSRGQAVANHAHHHERIDIAPRERRDHGRLERRRVVHDRRDGRGATRLHDELRPLQELQLRLGEHVL